MATTLPTYTGDITSLVQPTGNAVTDALIGGSKWGTGSVGTGAALTFSFPATVDAFDVQPNVAGNYNAQEPLQNGFSAYLQGFSALPADAQEAARAVLASWAAVADLKFTEVSASSADAGTLRFAYSGPAGLGATTYGVSWFPQDFAGSGDTWINSGFLFPEGWAKGTQNFLTMLHEAGHAIGLKHPHDTGLSGTTGWPVNQAVLPKTGDDILDSYSTQNMTMAYNDIPGMGSPLQADFAPTTPMQIDIAAIQYIYGPNMAYNAGDTVYTYSSTSRYNETIWDGGGRDTIRADGNDAALINLTPGNWSQLGMPLTFSNRKADLSVDQPVPSATDPFTVFIYDTVIIENAIGGGGNDRLVGNAASNWLQGAGGNDSLDGGTGIDIASYTGNRAGFTLAQSVTDFTVTNSTGTEGVDTLTNIERLVFADARIALDVIGGNAGTAAKVLGAVFGAAAVSNKTYMGIGLGYLDGGMSYADLMALALNAAGATTSNAVVSLLWSNLFGAAPTAAEAAPFVAMLDSGSYGAGALGMLAADTSLNTANINLVGLAQTGIEYI